VLFVGVIRLVPVTTLKIEAAGPATALIPFFFPLRPTLFLTVADIGLQCSDSPQVGNPRTVLCRAHGIGRAHAREAAGTQRPWPADKVERWAIDRLIPYAKNARTHTDAQVAAIAPSTSASWV
jgi:hypothetical protein